MKQFDIGLLDRLTRRALLQLYGGCGAMAATSLVSEILNLRLVNSAAAAIPGLNDYKALVCVFLSGGYDSFNVLTPYDEPEYTDYVTRRGGLASPDGSGLALPKNSTQQSNLVQITDPFQGGRNFGLHPGMGSAFTPTAGADLNPRYSVADLYTMGKLGFIANVGTLIAPTTMTQYSAGQNLPKGLFSHSDEVRNWQTSVPQTRSQAKGWAGRMTDMIYDPSAGDPNVFMSVALNSVNVFQTGNLVFPYVIGVGSSTNRYRDPATTLTGYNGTSSLDRILTNCTNNVLTQTYGDLVEKTHAKLRKGAIDAAVAFNDAVNDIDYTDIFPTTTLGNQLRNVARAIAARNTLIPDAPRRQIFFVSYGSWDHHSSLITNQNNMVPQVSAAIGAFYYQLEQLGVQDDVLLFTASDFSRTLTINGSVGSDHGWGSNQIVLGGRVNGGRVHRNYPTSLSNPRDANNLSLDTSRGRLIPTTSADELHAELAMWLGIPNDANLQAILPNIRNFFAGGSSSGPIGFIN